MAYFLRNALTKLRHKRRQAPFAQLERCRYCGLVSVNDTLFPFGMCTGPPDNPHKPVASHKLT